MEYVGMFKGHLPFLWSCGVLFPVQVCCAKKNLATLLEMSDLVCCTKEESGNPA
jgi:hypothetical protein